jgi:hypothetical protein
MLNVLAVAFPEMGYCQGLNFIVANLLILLDVKQCYNVMYHILFWQHHQKLMENLDKIHIKLYTLHRSFVDIQASFASTTPVSVSISKNGKLTQCSSHPLGSSHFLATLSHVPSFSAFSKFTLWKAKRFCIELLYKS